MVVMKELRKAGLIHENCMTATGRVIGEEIDMVRGDADGKVIYPVDAPLTPTGGVVGLMGNLAPEGAIVKVAGMATQEQSFTGPARVFESEEDAFEAVKKREYKEGEVLVIRNEGPAGGPGMREMLATTAALSGQGMGKKVAGPIGLLKDGDVITMNAVTGELSVDISDEDMAARRSEWSGPKETIYASGALWKYAKLVGGAKLGAVTHPGAKDERHIYMDL